MYIYKYVYINHISIIYLIKLTKGLPKFQKITTFGKQIANYKIFREKAKKLTSL